MFSPVLEKIKQEYKDLCQNPLSSFGFSLGLENENDITKWRFTLLAPPDCSYKGGFFKLSAQFPNGYPNVPPQICFLTPIYHLNVNEFAHSYLQGDPLGSICLGPLDFWKPNYTMRELICSIYSLFYYGNPHCAYNLNKADEYRYSRDVYEEKIKYFTKKYAKSDHQINYNINQDWNFTVAH